MLSLKHITKKYEIGTFKQTALDDLSLDFREKEFVCILGPSGSGKTTLLNIVGGLDRYDSGKIFINGKSTENFTDKQWDSYRNHAIGFVFQNYNLITHISVLENVEIGMTLSGLSPQERKDRAIEVLTRVGLIDHIHKKPNLLSGGQMQRVAIARALANDPDIILADEPTGAIDSETSRQIMTLIKEISKDKLVIMVTHDEAIAKAYANRIISLKDGRVINDTMAFTDTLDDEGTLKFKQTSMRFKQALKLSFNNLKTKVFRTFTTAFAGSIGIIGIALVLALANGLNSEIDRLETSTLAQFPIQIDEIAFNLEAAQQAGPPGTNNEDEGFDAFPDIDYIIPYERSLSPVQTFNVITDEYISYVNDLDPALYNDIGITRRVNMILFSESASDIVFRLNPGAINFEPTINNEDFFDESYDLLEGSAPTNETELLVVVDEFNRLNINLISELGFDTNTETIAYDDFIGKTFKVFYLDEFYSENESTNLFEPTRESGYRDLYESSAGITLTITGIARVKEDAPTSFLGSGLKYHQDLEELYINDAQNSTFGTAQLNSDTDIITGTMLTNQVKSNLLKTYGVDSTPSQIRIYPVDFEAKNAITDYLDDYNDSVSEDDQIVYTDLASIITTLTSDIIDGVSYVLIAFSAISLFVSSIMIGIITYVSVLERTKEIGILRSLGARKKDISRVFNAETTIIGFAAGTIGVIAAFLLTFPINIIIESLIDDISGLASLRFDHALVLIIISVILTFISGLIPARIASKKDPVVALRVD
ncbi:MAG: ATP-binding cassette domain-containing protein [Candidatus Izemoplasmataceae bacterium]